MWRDQKWQESEHQFENVNSGFVAGVRWKLTVLFLTGKHFFIGRCCLGGLHSETFHAERVFALTTRDLGSVERLKKTPAKSQECMNVFRTLLQNMRTHVWKNGKAAQCFKKNVFPLETLQRNYPLWELLPFQTEVLLAHASPNDNCHEVCKSHANCDKLRGSIKGGVRDNYIRIFSFSLLNRLELDYGL